MFVEVQSYTVNNEFSQGDLDRSPLYDILINTDQIISLEEKTHISGKMGPYYRILRMVSGKSYQLTIESGAELEEILRKINTIKSKEFESNF